MGEKQNQGSLIICERAPSPQHQWLSKQYDDGATGKVMTRLTRQPWFTSRREKSYHPYRFRPAGLTGNQSPKCWKDGKHASRLLQQFQHSALHLALKSFKTTLVADCSAGNQTARVRKFRPCHRHKRLGSNDESIVYWCTCLANPKNHQQQQQQHIS